MKNMYILISSSFLLPFVLWSCCNTELSIPTANISGEWEMRGRDTSYRWLLVQHGSSLSGTGVYHSSDGDMPIQLSGSVTGTNIVLNFTCKDKNEKKTFYTRHYVLTSNTKFMHGILIMTDELETRGEGLHGEFHIKGDRSPWSFIVTPSALLRPDDMQQLLNRESNQVPEDTTRKPADRQH
jgi:hypothetical protein